MSQKLNPVFKKNSLPNHFDLRVQDQSLIEYSQSQTSFINLNSQHQNLKINVKRDTKLELVIIVDNSGSYENEAKIICQINLEENAHLNLKYADLSNQNIEFEALINLKEPNSSLNFYSAVIAAQKFEKKIFINPVHLARNTTSDIVSYTIIKDYALGLVKCASDIRKGSTNSEAHQELRLLILDSTAKAHSDPILLIDENDIVASHANAIGMLDQEQIFYLNSRGLSKIEAQELLILGYFDPILETIKIHNPEYAQIILEGLKEKIN
ncbi:FeS assembly protein SufD [Spiroplasma sabaudiense Ar-1343]|uniref:FeS assembly protein SufD n=1 Tax=Spiroplasma sabaudiense Ar-1343 TaxID=1276257 RepID=W6AJY0_9MOLU|nr:SufD family Fe-S cluster assembly protein [Spiroplasma sabaudiense]AHI54034.1 FeS assembly protein SufD [Spiroplasma sabaudiense Ar-1343]